MNLLPTSNQMPELYDKELQILVDETDFLSVISLQKTDNATEHDSQKLLRVHCDLTNHDLVPKMEIIQQHLQSKRLAKAKEWYNFDFSKYAPFIVPHKRKAKCLFCNVTKQVLNRIPAQIEKHISGKRYQRLLKRVHIDVDQGSADGTKEFDANYFEFVNSQILQSSDEDTEHEEMVDQLDTQTLEDSPAVEDTAVHEPVRGHASKEKDDKNAMDVNGSAIVAAVTKKRSIRKRNIAMRKRPKCP